MLGHGRGLVEARVDEGQVIAFEIVFDRELPVGPNLEDRVRLGRRGHEFRQRTRPGQAFPTLD